MKMNKGFFKRQSKKQKCVCLAAAVLVAFVAVSFFSLLCDAFWTDTSDEVYVEIPVGAGVSEIADILKENEVISYKTAFRVYEKLLGGEVYQSGTHKFFVGESYGEVIEALLKKSESAVSVTIPEGYEMRQIAELLEASGVCQAKDFYAAAEGDFEEYPYIAEIPQRENRLEGYLFPDTYEFEMGSNARDVILTMLEAFDKKVYALYLKKEPQKSLDDIIIMASIVEREAASDSERAKVASVFYNRLKIGMKLQSCATVQYIIKERKDVLSVSDIKIDSPYNTYIYEGLPKGPIASPGVKSVMAAISPEKTDYYYFAATKDGSKNVFSKTGEEHLKRVKELQK